MVAHREGLLTEEVLVLRGDKQNHGQFKDKEGTLWNYILAVGAGQVDSQHVSSAMIHS